VLCCASGMHRKIGAGGRLRLRCGAWGESCEALGSSQQSPTRAFLQPAQAEAHSGELAKTLTRSSSCYLHSRHNDSLPISPIKHTHSQFLFFSFLLFRLIHRPPAPPPTTRSSTRASRCHASLARLLAFRGTILLELRVRDKDAPALLSQQHPRNTASSPSPPPLSQSPHPNTAHRTHPPPIPRPPPVDSAVSLATCSNPTPARLAFGPACCICKDSAASQSQSPTPSCVPVPAFLLQPATISPQQIYCPRDLTATA